MYLTFDLISLVIENQLGCEDVDGKPDTSETSLFGKVRKKRLASAVNNMRKLLIISHIGDIAKIIPTSKVTCTWLVP
jgi:hypothetical protein